MERMYNWTKKTGVLVVVFGMLSVFLYWSISLPQLEKIESFQIGKIENGKITAQVETVFFNPNWFSFGGEFLVAELFLENKKIGVGKILHKFSLPKNKSSKLTIATEINLDAFQGKLEDFLLAETCLMTCKIRTKFKPLGFSVREKINFEFNPTELINQLLTAEMKSNGLKLEKVQIAEMGLKETTFSVSYSVNNPFDFDLQLKNMTTAIYSDKTLNEKMGMWSQEQDITLKKGEQDKLSGLLVMNNLNSIQTGIEQIAKWKKEVYLVGECVIVIQGRQLFIPLKQKMEINLLTQKITLHEF